MYDEILISSIIQMIFLNTSIILFYYFILPRFLKYKLKNGLYVPLKLIKNVINQHQKNKIKKFFEDKKKHQVEFLKKNFIFLFSIFGLLLLIALIRFLINPKKFIYSLNIIISDIKGIFIIIIISIIINYVVILCMFNFMNIPYMLLLINKKINDYLLNHGEVVPIFNFN